MFGAVYNTLPVEGLADHYRQDSSFSAEVGRHLGVTRQSGAFRYDADAGNSFFLRELENIDKRLFEKKYAELPYLSLLPIVPGITPADEIYTWRRFDRKGKAVWGIPDSGMMVPKVDVGGMVEESSYIRSMVAGFGFSITEMRAAAQVGRPLDTMRADTARRAIAELQNKTALAGETQFGMYGLFNYPGVQTYTPSVDGSSNSAWVGSNKTSQQILNDMLGICNQVIVNSDNVHSVKRMCLPLAEYIFVSEAVFAPGAGYSTSDTILQAFQKRKPEVQVMPVLGLETASSTGGNRIIAYDPNPDYVSILLPIIFETFAPFFTGTSYDIVCHGRMGEIIVRYIDPMIYCDGI